MATCKVRFAGRRQATRRVGIVDDSTNEEESKQVRSAFERARDSEDLCVIRADLDDALSYTVQDLLACVSDLLRNVQAEVMGDLTGNQIAARCSHIVTPYAMRSELFARADEFVPLLLGCFTFTPARQLTGHRLQDGDSFGANVFDALHQLPRQDE
jgi:hypothetical protein